MLTDTIYISALLLLCIESDMLTDTIYISALLLLCIESDINLSFLEHL